MPAKAAREAEADEFHALEEKIRRTVELLKASREARATAERELARLRSRRNGQDGEAAGLRRELIELRREREDLKARVERILKQIDQLTARES
jgi:chromosome segregation ATPase